MSLSIRISTHPKLFQKIFDTSIFFRQENETVLRDDEGEVCEGLLTEKRMLRGTKTYGIRKDSWDWWIASGVLQRFLKDISSILISALNFSYELGQLSITQKRGVIKLIPKKDADPSLIKNWRPLTLLNCDYKIAAKSIANRLKSLIPNLINNNQTGFIKGRFIGENIRLLSFVSPKRIIFRA